MVRAPYTSEDRRIVISNDGKLTLRSADNSDAGVYRCIATNYLDADVLSFRVTVLSPDVEEEEVNGVKLSRSVGESLRLDCEETSSPQASVQWILPDHTVMVKVKVTPGGTLIIQQVSTFDRGHYKCMASNPAGIDTATVRLHVVAAPPGISEEKRQLMRAEAGQSGLSAVWLGNLFIFTVLLMAALDPTSFGPFQAAMS
ncbi:immunoglobulin superfamily member 10 [Astyanax mexicanus]|nr:immunoglobulin superfamily member 10 [Astyanax mexicanus]